VPAHLHPGVRYGGRAKGVKNKGTIEVEAILKRVGCNPIEGMAMIARGLDPETKLAALISMETRSKMYSELAQYIAPKRKAQEITGPDGGPVTASWLALPPK
jgi:hypothetical protein